MNDLVPKSDEWEAKEKTKYSTQFSYLKVYNKKSCFLDATASSGSYPCGQWSVGHNFRFATYLHKTTSLLTMYIPASLLVGE